MTDTATVANATLGVIEVSGADAGDFLRAQLTNDVDRLGPDRHFLAGWCDAKGRALMIARVAEIDDRYLLILPAGRVEPMLKRLRMFVLRAKVELADKSAAYRISGLIGNDLPETNRSKQREAHVLLGLPCGAETTARALALTPDGEAAPANAIANAVEIDSQTWMLADIDAGLPTLDSATQAVFIPQMLNLHWLMAIDFGKGCYPGQEIIARLHYRGRLTQRLFRLAWRGPKPASGADVVDADGTRQGTVIQAAGGNRAGRLLAVIKIDASTQRLFAGDAALEMLDLPYATPDRSA